MRNRQLGQAYIEYLIIVSMVILLIPVIQAVKTSVSDGFQRATEILIGHNPTDLSSGDVGVVHPVSAPDLASATKTTFMHELGVRGVDKDMIDAIGKSIDLGQMFYQDYINRTQSAGMTPAERYEAFRNSLATGGSTLIGGILPSGTGSLAGDLAIDQTMGAAVQAGADALAASMAPYVNEFVWWMYDNGVGAGRRKPGFPRDYFD